MKNFKVFILEQKNDNVIDEMLLDEKFHDYLLVNQESIENLLEHISDNPYEIYANYLLEADNQQLLLEAENVTEEEGDQWITTSTGKRMLVDKDGNAKTTLGGQVVIGTNVMPPSKVEKIKKENEDHAGKVEKIKGSIKKYKDKTKKIEDSKVKDKDLADFNNALKDVKLDKAKKIADKAKADHEKHKEVLKAATPEKRAADAAKEAELKAKLRDARINHRKHRKDNHRVHINEETTYISFIDFLSK